MIFTFTGRVISCSGLGGWEFVMGAEHGARGTGHRAQGTGLRAQGTEHGARGAGTGLAGLASRAGLASHLQ